MKPEIPRDMVPEWLGHSSVSVTDAIEDLRQLRGLCGVLLSNPPAQGDVSATDVAGLIGLVDAQLGRIEDHLEGLPSLFESLITRYGPEKKDNLTVLEEGGRR